MILSRISFGFVLPKAKKRDRETFEVKGPCELFGFGSGDFVEGPEAKDVQSDTTGRWFSFLVKDDSDLCILEADKRLPDHIRKMDIFGKVTCHITEVLYVEEFKQNKPVKDFEFCFANHIQLGFQQPFEPAYFMASRGIMLYVF